MPNHPKISYHIFPKSLQLKNECCNDFSCSHPNAQDNLSAFKMPLLAKLTFEGIMSFKTLQTKRKTLTCATLFQMKLYKRNLSRTAPWLKTLYVLEYFSLHSSRHNHLSNMLSCNEILTNKKQHSLQDLSSQAKSWVLHINPYLSTLHPPLAIYATNICLLLAISYNLLISSHNTPSLNQGSLQNHVSFPWPTILIKLPLNQPALLVPLPSWICMIFFHHKKYLLPLPTLTFLLCIYLESYTLNHNPSLFSLNLQHHLSKRAY